MGELILEGKATSAAPAYRLRVQQAAKPRAVDDLEKGMTNGPAAIRTPLNLPAWGHLGQMCILFAAEGRESPLAMAQADHADADKQLPMLERDELAAAATLKNPSDGARYGFASKTQLFRSAAADRNYNCLPRVMASLA